MNNNIYIIGEVDWALGGGDKVGRMNGGENLGQTRPRGS